MPDKLRRAIDREPGPTILISVDDDGDFIVNLENVPHWHLAAHGKTLGAALRMLADVVEAAERLD